MKTKVIMVRHGETQWNVECRFLGSVDMTLNEKGIRQAGYAAKALAEVPLDAAYSSPMKRAFQTGEIICQNRDISIHTEQGLAEICCGKWEGLNGEEVEARYPGQIQLWASQPEQLQIDGGETFQAVSDRIVEAFNRIVKQNSGKTILITSHMICLTLLMLHFEGKPVSEIWKVKPIGNAALNVVEVAEDDSVEIISWSDDSFVPLEDREGSALVAGRNKAE